MIIDNQLCDQFAKGSKGIFSLATKISILILGDLKTFKDCKWVCPKGSAHRKRLRNTPIDSQQTWRSLD